MTISIATNPHVDYSGLMNLDRIEEGKAINEVRRLQRLWDHWHHQRQMDPLRGKTAAEWLAESECARLAPKLQAAKARLAAAQERIAA
jgi:hypothetical protein